MVKAVFAAKKLPKSYGLGVFLSVKPFLPQKSFKIYYKALLSGGFCIIYQIIKRIFL